MHCFSIAPSLSGATHSSILEGVSRDGVVTPADEMTASQLIITVAGYGQSLKFRIELMLIFVLVIVVIVGL